MTHPIYHAKSSVNRFGGTVDDYLPIHHWLDATKEHYAGIRHRALRHHEQGIMEVLRLFGPQIKISDHSFVNVREICEAHIREDCGGRLPRIDDWFDNIEPKSWMPGNSPMSISLDEFVKKWGGIQSDYQPLIDWFEWAPMTFSNLTLKGYRYHAQGIFEAERTMGVSITNSDGRIIPVRYIAELHVKLHCGGRIPSVGDWLDCINPAVWMSRRYHTKEVEYVVDLHTIIAGLNDHPLDLNDFDLTDEELPNNFHDSVRMLRRPYASISKADFEELYRFTEGRGDVVKYRKVKMTFGTADGGWALMPLDDEHQDVVFY